MKRERFPSTVISMNCSSLSRHSTSKGIYSVKWMETCTHLSFHGHPGEIIVDGHTIKIESFASFMGRGFTNWVVHFGSCGMINTEKQRIHDFMEATGVSMVLGYKRHVDWIEATALDFLLLDWLQWYKDMRRRWHRFRNNYKDLISNTGLRAFHG